MGSQEHRSGAVVLVNCRGPLSMPRAELGIHGLNRWAVNCLEMSRKRGVQAARNAPSEDGKCWQRFELGIHNLNRWTANCLEMSRKRGVQVARNGPSEDRKCPVGGPGRPGWLPTQVSGKEVTSPPPPPLRTARERFPSCSSSLSNALRRTRLSHI